MNKEMLKLSQYVRKHPVLGESEEYKRRYTGTLEYFVNRYSAEDTYAKSMLELYKNMLLAQPENYEYKGDELRQISRGVLGFKRKKWKFFSYRYCLLTDVIFICSFLDNQKSEMIFRELSELYHQRYRKKLERLFQALIGEREDCDPLDQMEYLIACIKKNRQFLRIPDFHVLVTANMSAGKSTLLNAVVGKKVNKTQNDACTAKTHYLMNKAFEDGLLYEYDHDLELDASREILMKDNESNSGSEIFVGAKFRSMRDIDIPVCFIDTPGVNSSQDKEHKKIAETDILGSKYEKLMYVMNGENIGTDDDRRHLEFVAKNYRGDIVFVVNKLDRYRKEDSIPDTLQRLRKELEGLGYRQPVICPVSAYAAYLAKMDLFGEELNEDELDELDRFYRKFGKEEYQLNRYYPADDLDIGVLEDKNQQLLLHSGILSLEKILYEERQKI